MDGYLRYLLGFNFANELHKRFETRDVTVEHQEDFATIFI